MLINFAILLFLAFVAYWWASQGLFSALLHLVVTVVAGALALCVWEPIATRMLGTAVAPMAWGVGLLLPFAVALILLRLLADRLIRGNVQHQPIVSFVVGGAFGLGSAVLTAGITIIGLGFLPFGPAMAGIQPYAVSGNNEVVPGPASLWVPVDNWTEGFYDYLSKGAFGTATPLARYQPDLAEQANLSRLGLDENASRVAHPDNVEITELYAHPVQVPGLPDAIADTLGPEYQQANRQLVLLETTWKNLPDIPTTYDRDNTARVFWNQVRLVTDADDADGNLEVHGPIGITQQDVTTGGRVFRPWDDTQTFAFATTTEPLVFAFLLPEDADPTYVLIRNTRFDLTDEVPDTPTEPDSLVEAMGELDASAVADGEGEASAGPIEAGEEIGLSAQLPRGFSPNYAQGIDHNGAGAVNGGRGTARPGGRLSAKLAVNQMYAPDHQRMVRLTLDRRQAQSIFGNSLSSANRDAEIWLTDTNDNRWRPTGFVVDKGREAGMVIYYGPMDNASEIPTHEMAGNDTLYIYFLVSKGVTIDSYHLGDDFSQDINLPIPRN